MVDIVGWWQNFMLLKYSFTLYGVLLYRCRKRVCDVGYTNSVRADDILSLIINY